MGCDTMRLQLLLGAPDETTSGSRRMLADHFLESARQDVAELIARGYNVSITIEAG